MYYIPESLQILAIPSQKKFTINKSPIYGKFSRFFLNLQLVFSFSDSRWFNIQPQILFLFGNFFKWSRKTVFFLPLYFPGIRFKSRLSRPKNRMFRLSRPKNRMFRLSRPKNRMFRLSRPKNRMFRLSRPKNRMFRLSRPKNRMFRLSRPNFGMFQLSRPNKKCSTLFDPVQMFQFSRPKFDMFWLSWLFWQIFYKTFVYLTPHRYASTFSAKTRYVSFSRLSWPKFFDPNIKKKLIFLSK